MLYNRSFLFDITMQNYLLVCLLLMTDDSRLVLSFSSEKCNHDQLGFHLEDSMNCVAKLMFNKKNTSQVNLTSQAMKSFDIMVNVGHQCTFINDITYCFINHFGQCFNEQNNEGIAYIINFYLAKILNVTCDQKQDSQHKEEDSTYFWTLFYSYQSNSKFPLSFDRPCSNHELVSAFLPGVYPCIERYVISIFSSLTQFVINLFSQDKKSLTNCQDFVVFLNCLEENGCLSEREVKMTRGFIFTSYIVTMKLAVSAYEDYYEQYETTGYHDIDNRYVLMRITWWIIIDYLNDSCQNDLNQFSPMIDTSLLPNPEKMYSSNMELTLPDIRVLIHWFLSYLNVIETLALSLFIVTNLDLLLYELLFAWYIGLRLFHVVVHLWHIIFDVLITINDAILDNQ